ncbi:MULTISPECIES: isopenicillin N synthase family oxygenase [Halomonadaceae]|uniref:isopenicillin N synthase family dioxygenase n=1 Tax=Halomonadaceae TaxID=28256 RepID=UPI00159B465C|nr:MULTISPECIES: 2-oxoglutarate and iron-dependent oxygenase domain-containing protein [Halomonas]QJQ93869.1 isopenicillin N synthase family oxygenase [Halomonas sp. PA5]
MATTIPLIDMHGVREGDPQCLASAGEAIRQACTEVGFFYIVNHGLSQPTIDEALTAAKAFFDLPLERKVEVAVDKRHRGFHRRGGAIMYQATRPDEKEFYSMGLDLPEDDPCVRAGEALRGPNQWPSFMPELQRAMDAYFHEVGRCGADLLRAVAVSLSLDPGFFATKYRKPLQRTQAIYYPVQTAERPADQFGVAPHTDYGCITLLYQDNAGGLQVRELGSERWIDAPFIEGSLVVNVGDLLSRWSNDRFQSTLHRVINTSGRERYSIATFFDPTYDAVVDPKELGVSAEVVKYPPVAAGDYILGRIDASMSYRRSAS